MSAPTITDRFVELARTPQLGWAQMGISAPETVYEHSLDMARIARSIATQHYPAMDAERLSEMCMVHGLSELHWAGQIRGRHNTQHKLDAMAHIAATTAPGRELTRVAELFAEYHQNQTPMARLANQLDGLQMAQQSLRYEQANPYVTHGFVWMFAKRNLQDLPLQNAFEALARQRPAGIDQQPSPTPLELTAARIKVVTAETLARVGNLDAVRAERKAAFAGPVYRT